MVKNLWINKKHTKHKDKSINSTDKAKKTTQKTT